jgi:hypothetical protein
MGPRKPTIVATPSPPTEADRIQRMRDWVIDAERQGAQKSDLLLRLTHRDVATIKRHPSVRSNEVAFEPEGMRFLGVRVAEGGVAVSLLELAQS